MKKDLSVNRLAWKLLEGFIENPDLYGVKVGETSSGTIIIDAGIEVIGGFQAGKLITQICMGGCGRVEITSKKYGDMELQSVFVFTDHPAIATLGSQYAGWQVNEEGYFAIGSGPARALALRPKAIYEEIRYKDESDKAVVILETCKYPPAQLIDRIVKDCKILHENLAVILTPTASVAGATQISGRIVETGIHKLRKVGLDPNVISHAWGIAPIPPVHPEFANAMARTNDAILYGGTAYYAVECDDDDELKRIADNAPSEASKQYGRPFMELFKEADYDLYKIDPSLFAPAAVIVNNMRTGNVFRAGKINARILAESFGF